MSPVSQLGQVSPTQSQKLEQEVFSPIGEARELRTDSGLRSLMETEYGLASLFPLPSVLPSLLYISPTEGMGLAYMG
jgi:hypothetical protein